LQLVEESKTHLACGSNTTGTDITPLNMVAISKNACEKDKGVESGKVEKNNLNGISKIAFFWRGGGGGSTFILNFLLLTSAEHSFELLCLSSDEKQEQDEKIIKSAGCTFLEYMT